MARIWLSITVELVEGGGRVFWPRPVRTIAAAATHSFSQFADAIDDAFARWDRAHLRQFRHADGRVIARPDTDWGGRALLDEDATKLRILSPGERFVFADRHETEDYGNNAFLYLRGMDFANNYYGRELARQLRAASEANFDQRLFDAAERFVRANKACTISDSENALNGTEDPRYTDSSRCGLA